MTLKTKQEIVKDWLPRYTGRPLGKFGRYVLLTNFTNYVERFAERFDVPVLGRDRPMQSATAEGLTILNFGMGSAMAATVMDLLASVPSVVFGLVGFIILKAPLQHLFRTIGNAVAGIPGLRTVFGQGSSGTSLLTAGIVLAIMITPITMWCRCTPPDEALPQPRRRATRVYRRVNANVSTNAMRRRSSGSLLSL